MSERVYSESSKERKHFPETKKRKQREPGKYFAKQRKKSTKNKTQKTVTAHKSLINKTYPKPFKTESKNY